MGWSMKDELVLRERLTPIEVMSHNDLHLQVSKRKHTPLISQVSLQVNSFKSHQFTTSSNLKILQK